MWNCHRCVDFFYSLVCKLRQCVCLICVNTATLSLAFGSALVCIKSVWICEFSWIDLNCLVSRPRWKVRLHACVYLHQNNVRSSSSSSETSVTSSSKTSNTNRMLTPGWRRFGPSRKSKKSQSRINLYINKDCNF